MNREPYLARIAAADNEVEGRWAARLTGVDAPYTQATLLAEALIDEVGDVGALQLRTVFMRIEAELARSDGESRAVLITGLLEDLQTISMNRGVNLDTWTAWLGPLTRQAWDAVSAVWAGRLAPDKYNEFIRTGRI